MFLGFCGCLVLGLAVSLPVLATPKLHTFHIEAGDAVLTLNEFSRQSSLQLLFDYNIVRGRKTRAVSGEYDAPAALQQMLIDTGLVFDFVNDRTLAVTPVSHAGGAGSAVADAASGAALHARSAEIQSVERGQEDSGSAASASNAPEPQEVVITGTHVRGEQPVGDQLISLNREDIDSSGAATVQDFLRTLPQTFGGGPSEDTHFFSSETQTNSGLGSGINLRGLGAGATLVLINGKRLAPSGSEAAFADIESIPLSAVERMDVLPDSASALYGSDAVGGVVNFVMRDNFTGAESVVRSGSGTQHTLREYLAAQTLGTRWDSGSGMLSLEYYRRDALPSSVRRYATSNLVPLGGTNLGTFLSNPGNIVVGGQYYPIPHGQNGTSLTASDLVAGPPNLSDKYTDADILPSQRRVSLYGSGRQALNDRLTLFGTALLSQRNARQLTGGFQGQVEVPSSNPFYVNPAGGTAPVTVDYNFLDDLGSASNDVLVNNLNVTLGLDIAVGDAWQLSLYTNYAQERENQFNSRGVDLGALNAALADPDPRAAFNPFADGSNTSPVTRAAIAAGNRFHTNSRLRSADVAADGPIGHLPGGTIKLALGVDRRNQVFNTRLTTTTIGRQISTNLSRNVSAVFGEITVPIFGADNGGKGYRRLELSLAGRYEDYSDFGHAATPKLGMVWSPLETLSFRGTWGRSIRAPTLSDLDTSLNYVIPFSLADNTAAAGLSKVLIESGKNAHLTVERAHSWTTGFDLDARRWVTGLTFSATYFSIDFSDRIQQPQFNPDILNDPRFADLVTRGPSAAQLASACAQGMFPLGTAADCRQYAADAILDIRIQNMETLRTQGIDFKTDYERAWAAGTLKLSLSGTYLFHFSRQEGADAPPEQLLNTQNNPINLRMRGGLSWQQRRWGATVGVNFQNRYTDTVSEPNRPISSYTTFDTQLRYELAPFSTSFVQNTRLELNAINVFNRSPPFLNNQVASLGYDQENADPLGRLVSLQVRKTW